MRTQKHGNSAVIIKIKTSISFEISGPSRSKGDNWKLELDWGSQPTLYHRN